MSDVKYGTRADILEGICDSLALAAERLKDINKDTTNAEASRMLTLARNATQEAQSWIHRALEQK